MPVIRVRNKEQQRLALELRTKGLTYSEIGGQLGISRQRVQQIVSPSLGIFDVVKRLANGRCADCGVELGRGHIHHIKNEDIEPDLYNHPDNLAYLCAACHRSPRRQAEHGMICNPKPPRSKRPKPDGTIVCPVHGPINCPKCSGSQGGYSTSEAKSAAARENGKRGGRPKKEK